MDNILAAQCTVITVISILFGLWYSEINDVVSVEIKHLSDNHLKKDIRKILFSKILILLLALLFNAYIFFKPFIEVCKSVSTINIFGDKFDAINASVFFVFILNAYILSISIIWLIRAIKKLFTRCK